MKPLLPAFVTLCVLLCLSCNDEPAIIISQPLPETTTTVTGKAVIKVLPYSQGWVSLQETLQPQYLITQPKRELIWLSNDFHEVSAFRAPEGWSLIDAVVHPSGQVSAALVNVDIKRSHLLEMKVLRIQPNGLTNEFILQPLPASGERTRYFPASLDRIRLEAFNEDVYVISRGEYNEVEASRLSFVNNQFQMKWQTLIEPDAYAGSIGIIGGGYDNFHQGDRYFFVYSGVDAQGNLYVAVPSHEDVIQSHDSKFNENLMAETNPGSYDWGVAILTKVSSSGVRRYSHLEGKQSNKRIINMRVGNDKVFLLGRVKTTKEPGGWDAWLLAADASTGNTTYENQIDVQDGDMFWDVNPMNNGEVLAVGTKSYTQNPAGLSVSDSRLALAVVLDMQGKVTEEILLPQGPSQRGSEAMYVKLLGNGSVLFAGLHNAPGTHAEVYCDGFIAVRNFNEK
jgi:hypothetical protein